MKTFMFYATEYLMDKRNMKKSVFSITIGKEKKFFDNTNKNESALYRSQFERAVRIHEYLEERSDKAHVEALRHKYFTKFA